MDITFKTEVGRFNFRVAGVMIHDEKLLVMTDERASYYYLPGGRVNMHETGEEAILREVKEELDVEIKVNRMLWSVENFFHAEQTGEAFHELSFYYLLDVTDKRLLDKGEEFIINEGGYQLLTFKWVPLEEVKDLYIYPTFIREKIFELPSELEHMVERK